MTCSMSSARTAVFSDGTSASPKSQVRDDEIDEMSDAELFPADERDGRRRAVGPRAPAAGYRSKGIDSRGERIPYEFTGTQLTDADGARVGTVSIGRHLRTQSVRTELERQNQRLEEFANIVSHDLRNPLAVAQGHLELAREKRSERSTRCRVPVSECER